MARTRRNPRFDLPPLELECMKALWALGGGTVHEIRARLLPERPLAYTTVMTVMDRLARKGVVEREKQGRAYLYRSMTAEDLVREHALERLVKDFFRGSREQLRVHLETAGAKAAIPGAAAPEAVAKPRPLGAAEPGIDPTLL